MSILHFYFGILLQKCRKLFLTKCLFIPYKCSIFALAFASIFLKGAGKTA